MAVTTVLYRIIAADGASRSFDRIGRSAAGAHGSIAKMALGAVGLGASLAGVAAGITMAARATIDFNAQMLKIQTQAGGSAADVEVLSKAVLKLAPSTQQGPQALAKSLYYLKSVGMDNAAAMKALAASSDLAATGGADLVATTNALAGAWGSGIKGAQNFTNAAATVNAIVGAGKMTMDDFVGAIGTGFLSTAQTFGISLASVGSALAALTRAGMPADAAATRLRMTISLMGAPSQKASSALAKIGLTGTELANTMRGPTGLVGAIGLLKSHMDAAGLSATQQAQLMAQAFGGGRSSAAIMALVGNYAQLQRTQDMVNSSISQYGSKVAAQRATVEAEIGRMRSGLQTAAIQLGAAFLPAINAIVGAINKYLIPAMLYVIAFLTPAAKAAFDALGGAIKSVVGWMKQMGPMQIILVGIGAGLITYGIGMGVAAAGTWAWTVAQRALNAAMHANPIILIISIIVMLGVAIYLLVAKCAWFRAIFIELWRITAAAAMWFYQNVLVPIGRGAVVVFGWIIAAIRWLSPVWQALGDFFVHVWKGYLWPIISEFAKSFRPIGDAVLWVWNNMIYPAFKAIGWVFTEIVAKGIKWAWDWIIWPALQNTGKAFSDLWKGMQWVWDHGIHPVIKAFGDAIGWIGKCFVAMWQAVLLPALRLLVMTFLDVVGKVIGGAAKMFGWVPGVGGLLKGAAKAFGTFRDDVNKALGGVQPKTVPVTVSWNGVPQGKITGHSFTSTTGFTYAAGGIIPTNIGVKGKDSVPVWAMPGEFIMNAQATAANLPALEYMNAKGYAAGGVVKPFHGAPRMGGFTDAVIKDMELAKDLDIRQYAPILASAYAKAYFMAMGGANVAQALTWAQSQAGKPYQWGGNGNPSWDCSGFMSAIESVIRGESPHRRWTTYSFSGAVAAPGWTQNLQAPFMIGVTDAGVGHTAGTLMGVNVESRGGQGVIVGPGARGYNNPLFKWRYGFIGSIGGGGSGIGPVSSNGVANYRSWAVALLRALGYSQSYANLRFMYDWALSEGGPMSNPLNVGIYSAGTSQPVQSVAAGITRTANAINNGYYNGIKAGLAASDYWAAVHALWASPWAASHYGYGSRWSTATYDSGGLMMGRGSFRKTTDEPERVLSPSQTRAFEEWMSGGGGWGSPQVHVYLGSREITDIVKVEVKKAGSEQAYRNRSGRS